MQEAEGVEVLDFAARAEGLAGFAYRDVGVAAEGAFLHVAVADADPAHEAVQRTGVVHGLSGRAHVGLGNDFEQRRSGTVEVDAGAAVEVFVQRFAGVFFQVGARQLHDLGGGSVTLTEL